MLGLVLEIKSPLYWTWQENVQQYEQGVDFFSTVCAMAGAAITSNAKSLTPIYCSESTTPHIGYRAVTILSKKQGRDCSPAAGDVKERHEGGRCLTYCLAGWITLLCVVCSCGTSDMDVQAAAAHRSLQPACFLVIFLLDHRKHFCRQASKVMLLNLYACTEISWYMVFSSCV